MVKINKQVKVPGGLGGFISIAVGVLFVLGMSFSGGGYTPERVATTANLLNTNLSTLDDATNKAQLKLWRQKLRDQCTAATTIADVEALSAKQIEGFTMPLLRAPQPRNENAVKKCRNVVMDFGANVGDTSGHVVDTGMISCERSADLKTSTEASHFNLEAKHFELVKKRNMLTKNIEKLMKEVQGDTIGPEDYCYYGIEGNPHFTDRLQNIEDYVMAIRPRPIQHMHFFTESVGAGADGMTKLYLDTINSKENFWGSSIFSGHQDVKKSAGDNSVETVAAPVMGYTIGTLMRKTLAAFDPSASDEEKKGSHLILKVDIEGGEYPLLNEAVEEGTLCQFVRMGNTADLFIEFHSQKVTGKHEFIGKTKQMKDTLGECGVTFRNLAAWWG